MAGKFNKKVKYQKKNFNIYRKINDIKPKSVKKSQITQEKIQKPKYSDLSDNQKRKFNVERKGFFEGLFGRLGDIFDFLRK